jgi:hypothetical protein
MGFPRGFRNQFNVAFGVDTGFNVESDFVHTLACPTQYNPADYTNGITMATFKPGQKINMVWPAKNHVADTCTNQFIPDHGVYITRGSRPMTEDFSVNISLVNPKHQNGVIDHQGFQRCFNFCDNTDKSPCINTFELDNDFPSSGIYAFKWVWEFNQGQFYTTCFDAYVSIDNTSPVATPSVTVPSSVPTPVETTQTPTTPTITIPPAVPTPSVTVPSSVPTPVKTTQIPTTPTVTEKKPDIVSSANELSSFLSMLTNHILHIDFHIMEYLNTTNMSLKGMFNITLT